MTRSGRAWAIAVGDEIAWGRRRDLNGDRIARRLEALGCDVVGRSLLPDDVATVAREVRFVLEQGLDLVTVTGGLGPTADDVTREGVAEGLGLSLAIDPEALAAVERRYRDRGRELPEGAQRQALIPEGAELVPNPIGTAPGFARRCGRTLVVALPGVPREFEAMWVRSVQPRLERELAGGVVRTVTLRVVGLTEAEVDRRVRSAAGAGSDASTRIGLLADGGGEVEVHVVVRDAVEAEAEAVLAERVAAIERALGDCCYERGERPLAAVVGDALVEAGRRLATAESCTGGLVAARITAIDGASRYFVGGVNAYSDEVKARLLDVPPARLETFGAVSAEVASSMARGARRRFASDAAVSVTGIAGPGGGSPDKPIGLVYLGCSVGDEMRVTRHLFTGDRERIRRWAATFAVEQLRRALAGLEPLGEVVAPAPDPDQAARGDEREGDDPA